VVELENEEMVGGQLNIAVLLPLFTPHINSFEVYP
jgi:hypothetical protein